MDVIVRSSSKAHYNVRIHLSKKVEKRNGQKEVASNTVQETSLCTIGRNEMYGWKTENVIEVTIRRIAF